MYLDGHREILDELLETRLPPRVLADWPGGVKEAAVLKAIQRGLAYPDLPCGRVDIEKGDTRAILRRPLLCSALALVQLLAPRSHQYSEMFQSHLGALAHVHAMAPGHRVPTAVVAAAIASHALSLSLLFWRCFELKPGKHKEEREKNGPFWLGILLHTLTDSYADAHAIRVPNVALARAPPPDEEQDRVMRHSALLYELAGRTLDAPLKKKALGAEIEKARRVKKRGVLHIKQQHQTYMLFVMHRQTDRAVRTHLPGADRAIAAAVRGKSRAAKATTKTAHDIRAFSYYPTQPQPLYHALRDRLQLVRDRPAMWDRMLGESAELVRIFKAGAEEAGSSDRASPRRFLARVLAFLLTGPLRLASGAASRPPMNYNDSADARGKGTMASLVRFFT